MRSLISINLFLIGIFLFSAPSFSREFHQYHLDGTFSHNTGKRIEFSCLFNTIFSKAQFSQKSYQLGIIGRINGNLAAYPISAFSRIFAASEVNTKLVLEVTSAKTGNTFTMDRATIAVFEDYGGGRFGIFNTKRNHFSYCFKDPITGETKTAYTVLSPAGVVGVNEIVMSGHLGRQSALSSGTEDIFDACNTNSASCVIKNGVKWCSLTGQSEIQCDSQTSYPSIDEYLSLSKDDVILQINKKIGECKARGLGEYKERHEGSPLSYWGFLALMKNCEYCPDC